MTRTRGYLPHLEGPRPAYFVTFRLADSLPRELMQQLQEERAAIGKADAHGTTVEADHVRLAALRALLQKAERSLDSGLGQCHLREPHIAQLVANALRHFEGQRYSLLAWCVMPNHVHVVFSPLGKYTLETILHSWKSFSAQQANRLLGRTGSFWQREYFDHLVRSQASLRKIIQYVRDNPKKAGLHNWPWIGVLSKEANASSPAENPVHRPRSHVVPPASSRLLLFSASLLVPLIKTLA